MCVGIILKDGRHLQTIKEIEKHFQCNLEPYKWVLNDELIKNCCTCQIDLNRFMNDPLRAELFEYDYLEYWEK
jgi:hypothetical protein